MNELDIEVV